MARIPQETINRINDTADIVDVVSKYVDLKKRGRNFFGLCPFHNEKTPSFSVAPDKGIYHCFGCGNGGNAVNFIMEYEKISFVDAIQELGGQLGIDVEFSGDNKSKEFFHALYEIHNLAANLYHKTLFSDKGKKAKQYLLDRGIDENLIKLFKIGFAPKNSKFLLESIKAKQYKKDVIEKSGLFGFSNSEIYDRFRSRIMFPIFNTSNKVIAFGGRVFGVDDPAKYMNSPETPLYHKSEIFYGLNLSRDIIHKENYAILVEGYTDVIQLFQAGIKNVIAVSGTAFTEQHVNQIRRLTSKVFLAYDGDSAGTNATLRAGYALLKGGVEPKIIEIPDNLDPDEWVKKEGPTVFKSNGIDKAIGVLNFQLKSSNFSQVSSVEKSNIIKDILSVVNKIQDPIIQQNLVKGLAQAAGVEENQIIHMLSKQATRYRSRQTKDENDKPSKLFSTVNGKAELGIIQVLSGNNDEAKILLKEKLDVNKIETLQIKKLVEILLKSNKVNPAEIISHFEDQDEREIISEVLMLDDQTSEHLEMAKDCLTTLSKISVKEKIKQLRLQIREMETAGENTNELMIKVVEMQKDLND
mgnify:FL=1